MVKKKLYKTSKKAITKGFTKARGRPPSSEEIAYYKSQHKKANINWKEKPKRKRSSSATKKLDKSRKKTLFKKPKHKKYAEMISFENPTQARISARKLRKEFREAKQNAKKRRVARATQYASNRAKAITKRKKLSIDERKQYKEIGKIYGDLANTLWERYNKDR